MTTSIFNRTTVPVLQEVLNFAQARHGVLVSNIANVDTPGYKTRDLNVDSFQEKLKAAIAHKPARHDPASPGIVATQPGDPMRGVRESLTNILYHDETNISLEHQVNEISKNQMLHNTAIAILSQQFRLLQAAISERI